MKRIGIATALELRATGINYAFAPCIAVFAMFNLMKLPTISSSSFSLNEDFSF